MNCHEHLIARMCGMMQQLEVPPSSRCEKHGARTVSKLLENGSDSASESRYANWRRRIICTSSESAKRFNDMSMEEILRHQPDLREAALFLVNCINHKPSATVYGLLRAAWDAQRSDSHGDGQCFTTLFAHGIFAMKKQ
jgi:hypothetical protein